MTKNRNFCVMGGITVNFKVLYWTEWGQNLVVSGEGALLGNFDVKRGHQMTCSHLGDTLLWECAVTIPLMSSITYKYVVTGEHSEVHKTENTTRTIDLPPDLESGDAIELLDVWQDDSNPACVLSKGAFAKVILSDKTVVTKGSPPREAVSMTAAIVRFIVSDWQLQDGESVCITGGLPQLGNWQPLQMLPMTERKTPIWEAEVSVPLSAFPFTYKYAIVETGGNVILEHGENHIVSLPPGEGITVKAPRMLVRSDGFFRREHPWRGAGIAVPVFSLRTASSCGCGEFEDIKALVDFCNAAGMRLIQLLPVNDTCVHMTWWDTYPYSSLSVFALHPMYMRLELLSEDVPEGIQAEIDTLRVELDGKTDMDYETMMSAKLRIARQLYNLQGQQTLQSEEFAEFFAASKEWLQPYACFCFLRDLFGTAEHWQWGTFANFTPEIVTRLCSREREFADSIQFMYYLQYHLHCQLLDVSCYAQSMRVSLKGDLPIGVSKCSVDTWMYPSLFRMNVSTGAPPDYFDPKGQNWGFPTYNWEEMAKDGYDWWRRRLQAMAQYFHAYRIDHILGFFRIWEIPGDCTTGLLGRFRPSHPIWHQELEHKGLWDIDRLCEPWITWHILEEVFGDLASEVASRYLVEYKPQHYKLRAQYASEEKIQSVQPRPGSPGWLVSEVESTRKGLMALRHNVALLRDPEDADRFYPRFSLTDTRSFRELESPWQEPLSALHDDYYFKRQDRLWAGHALRVLPALMGASDMLVCGEDLGMIPACVPPVMEQLGLIGLRIQRMPSEANAEFGDCSKYPYTVVASPSCHDTTTTRAWWEEDQARRERYYYSVLKGMGQAPSVCTPEVMRAIVQQHLESPAMWAIFPLQDIMALSPLYTSRTAKEETINDPTNNRHYWKYRMHVRVEDLTADLHLIADLQELALGAGRCKLSDLPVHYTQPVGK